MLDYIMTNLKEELRSKIKEKRPNLSDNSAKTYISSLLNLNKKMEGDDDVEWFDKNAEEIIKYLEKYNPKTAKTILSAIYIITGNETIHKVMIELANDVNEQYKKQTKSTKQEENWISKEEIKEKYDEYKLKADQIIKQKILSKKDIDYIVKFILLAFLSGVNFPVRRSKDYSELMIRNYDKKINNYYEKGLLIFQDYKTDKIYGKQEQKVPETLKKFLNKWCKINTKDFMLISSNGNKLTSPQITRLLNEVFDGKKISSSMLRHVNITDLYKDMPKLNEIKKMAEKYGHSLNTHLEYIKK